MISSKYIDKIIFFSMLTAIVLSLLMLSNPIQDGRVSQDAGTLQDYEKKLFDTSKPITIDIIMDTDQWTGLLKNASEKKWKSCDVIVNGTRFYNVGIRAKGDSSLSSIAMAPNSNRYSFKLEFDKFVDGQKCFGLDKLCLNNNYGDATNMKEAFVYDMFRYLGADASLYNYARISINGNFWGLYLALEEVEDSFLSRNYGNQKGALYKPGAGKGQESDSEWSIEDMQKLMAEADAVNTDTANSDDINEYYGEGGADLKYLDDDPASYWGIWPNQKIKTDETDHRRVIEALKNISEKNDIEKYMDIDNVVRYMAVHNFSVNNDSLSGDGAHNYYLYETEGRLNLIPWDYNLCFGGYEMEQDTVETAKAMINFPIDDSWALTSFFDGILQNEKYRNLYHQYYRQLIDRYILGGKFDVFYARTRNLIDSLIKTDPNALYTYEKYDAAAAMFKEAVKLRGESISGQLNGTIPSTLEGQKLKPEVLIDAENIDLQTMGSDDVGEVERKDDEDSPEDWTAQMNAYFEEQKMIKQNTIRRNMLKIGVSFVMMLSVLGFAVIYRRR